MNPSPQFSSPVSIPDSPSEGKQEHYPKPNINSITATNFTHTQQSTPINISMYLSIVFAPESSAPTSPTEATHGYFPSLIPAEFGPQPIQCPHSTRLL
ncbi:hypothetical protein ACKAV7_011247 [Fusarium commune]